MASRSGDAAIMSPESIARWWGVDPVLHAPADARRGGCALWQFRGRSDDFEVTGEPDPQTHIVSIYGTGLASQEYFGNGRRRFHRQCRPGLVNIVRAGERPRAVLSSSTATFSFFHVYLPHAALCDLVAQEGLADPREVELIDPQGAEDAGIEQIGRSLVGELRDGGPLARLRLDTLHQDLAIQVLRRHSNLSRPAFARGTARGGLAPWQLTRALEALEAHLGGDVGLDMLAAIAGCSPTHFSRAFKQSTGKPPFRWLLERRIARAKDLLAGGRMSFAEVALAVGFSAQPQFTTAFKRATGTTPGAWRRERLG